jgi:hypothetical protein
MEFYLRPSEKNGPSSSDFGETALIADPLYRIL